MLAKYISESKIITDRSSIILDDKLIINPTDEQLRKAGYLEVIEGEPADKATVSYSLEGDKIVKVYTPVNETEQPAPDTDNALNKFITTLASTETNSIAKIRAAAQEFLNNTEGQ